MELEDIYTENYLTPAKPVRSLEDRIKDLKSYISDIYTGIDSLKKHFRNGRAGKASRVIQTEILQVLALLKTHILPSTRNFDDMGIKEKMAQIQKIFGATHMAISQIKSLSDDVEHSQTFQDLETKISVITNFFTEYIYEINRHRE